MNSKKKRVFERNGIRLTLARNNLDRFSVFLAPTSGSLVTPYHTKRMARGLAKALREAADHVEQWTEKVGQ